MEKNRYINTKFWTDGYIEELDPIQKLIFLYCITNQYTNIAGIYEISMRDITVFTGIEKDTVMRILKKFEEDGKIKYQNGWIAIKNWRKHQKINPSIIAGIEAIQKTAPNELVIWQNGGSIEITEPEQPVNSLSTGCDTSLHSNHNHNLNSNHNHNQKCAPDKPDATDYEIIISFPCKNAQTVAVTQADIDSYQKAHPKINVKNQFQKMHEWLKANPERLKTAKGVPRFIVNWLNRAENDKNNNGEVLSQWNIK